jgi:protein-S-isoprenylcysteine O-methyltransferase Ste14
MTVPDGRSSLFRFVPSQEEAVRNANNSRLAPVAVGLLLFLVLFIAIVAGTAYIQMGSEALGMAIYIVAAVAMSFLYLAWRIMARG